jgi:D-glycero-alpha-D-manno-heptose-7-phosphate kinase
MSAEESRTLKVRAPTRLDLGGEWTDVPPYSEEQGGFVCNVAIARYATATLATKLTTNGAVGLAADARNDSHAAADAPLVRAACRRAGMDGVRVTIGSDFPVSAGLGGSSAASAALLGAFAAWRGEKWDHCEIAEEGRRIEVEELGIAGGRQDHYAATHGGALALTFSDRVDVRRIALSARMRAEFERRTILLYTGESRISGSNITEVVRAYQNHEARVIIALARMKTLAEQISVALEAGDLDGVGTLMGEHWEHQRALHPAIPTPLIDEIVRRAAGAGALGSKAMGASGGGCVLAIAGAGAVDRVRAAISPLGSVVPFTLDTGGLTRC